MILILLGQETSKSSSNGIVIAVGSGGTIVRQRFTGMLAGFFARNANNVLVGAEIVMSIVVMMSITTTRMWRGRRRGRRSHGVMIVASVAVAIAIVII